jgi:hypothetical protein
MISLLLGKHVGYVLSRRYAQKYPRSSVLLNISIWSAQRHRISPAEGKTLMPHCLCRHPVGNRPIEVSLSHSFSKKTTKISNDIICDEEKGYTKAFLAFKMLHAFRANKRNIQVLSYTNNPRQQNKVTYLRFPKMCFVPSSSSTHLSVCSAAAVAVSCWFINIKFATSVSIPEKH